MSRRRCLASRAGVRKRMTIDTSMAGFTIALTGVVVGLLLFYTYDLNTNTFDETRGWGSGSDGGTWDNDKQLQIFQEGIDSYYNEITQRDLMKEHLEANPP